MIYLDLMWEGTELSQLCEILVDKTNVDWLYMLYFSFFSKHWKGQGSNLLFL